MSYHVIYCVTLQLTLHFQNCAVYVGDITSYDHHDHTFCRIDIDKLVVYIRDVHYHYHRNQSGKKFINK